MKTLLTLKTIVSGLLLLLLGGPLQIMAGNQHIVVPHAMAQTGLPVGILQGEEDKYEVVSFTIQTDSFSYDMYRNISDGVYRQYAILHTWSGRLNGKTYVSRRNFMKDLSSCSDVKDVFEQIVYRTDAELLSTLEYGENKIILTNKKVNHSIIVYKYRDLKDWLKSLWILRIIR